jgi:hypothetical protein
MRLEQSQKVSESGISDVVRKRLAARGSRFGVGYGASVAAAYAMLSIRSKLSVLINVALFCAVMLACFFGAEYLLRNKLRFYPVQMGWVGQFQNRHSDRFIPDAQTGWHMRPNESFMWAMDGPAKLYRSNAQGFRSGAEFDPRDRRFKIAFVGDSFTYGTGVSEEEAYPGVVSAAARNRVSWNFGMPGFGVDQMWLSTRYQALPLKPDLLIVGLINVDFERSQAAFRRFEGFAKPTFRLVGSRLVQRTTESAPNFIMQYLDERSRVWSMWIGAKRWFGLQYGYGEYWTLNQAIIAAIREDCRKAGVPVLFAYIPAKGMKPFPSLRAYMERTGAAYIDLTEQRPVPPPSIYLRHDSHLSVEGHRYVGNLIDSWIKSHLESDRRSLQAASH